MQIDIISDTVCPWCFIGKRRLEKALASRPDLQPVITWRPFQLNPDMPAEGHDRAAYLAAKFGGPERAERMYQNVRDAGAADSIPFAFEKMLRMPNSLASHCVMRWAIAPGLQWQMAERLFSAYFIEGRDVGDHATLAELAGEVGLDARLVRELLDAGRDRDQVAAEDQVAREMGIEGVPCFIFERKYAVSGAQDPAVFLQVFDVVEREAAGAAG